MRRLLPKYISRVGFIPAASAFSLECRVRNTNLRIFKESSFRSHVRRSSLSETAVNRPRVRENCFISAIFVNARFRVFTASCNIECKITNQEHYAVTDRVFMFIQVFNKESSEEMSLT